MMKATGAAEDFSGRRWGRKEGKAAVQAWAASGMTKRAYCQGTGVPEHRLRYWVVRCGGTEDPGAVKPDTAAPAATFFTMAASNGRDKTSSAGTHDTIEVQIGEDIKVWVPAMNERRQFVETIRWLREAAQG